MTPDDPATGTDVQEPQPPESQMTLIEHLTELRSVLIQCIVASVVASVLCWFISEKATDLLLQPAVRAGSPLVFITPTGAFMMRLKLSAGLGLFLAMPIVVWRVWAFVVPGLLRRERSLLLPVVSSSVVLVALGAAFAYLVILPISLSVLLGFGTESLEPMITAEHYFAFAIRLTLAFGLVFQFPLVVSILTYWEILGPDFLKKYWRYGVVLVFVLSAMLTPPDVASQVLMAGPVLLLYFGSMGLARVIAKRKRQAREREEQERSGE